MKIMNFKSWLLMKFLEWEKAQNKRVNYSEFARYLGVKVSTLTAWRLGNNIPSYEMAVSLSEKLGADVFHFLNYSIPSGSDSGSIENFPFDLKEALKRSNERVKALGTPVDLSISLTILAEEIKPFGWKLTSNDNPDSLTK